MAKFMFLFYILLALVHENVARYKNPRPPTTTQAPPSTPFNLDNCVAARKTHKEFVDWGETIQVKLAKVTCMMEKMGVMNKYHLMDSDKLNAVSLRAFKREGSEEDIQKRIIITSHKATFEKAGDTVVNIYAYFTSLMAVLPGLKDTINTDNLP